MKIAFVHTPMPEIIVPERELFWQNFDIRYHIMHPNLHPMEKQLWELPHWMTWLGGVLENAGFLSLNVIGLYSQCNFSGINVNQFKKEILSSNSDVFLFSPMTVNLNYSFEIAALIKNIYPNSIIIFGGITSSPLYADIISHQYVDFVIYDRGEYSLPNLLNIIKNKDGKIRLDKIGNLVYRNEKGIIIKNTKQYPQISLEDLPFPRVNLFPKETGKNIRYLRQVYSLGCPYRCEFCSIQTNGQQQKYFPINRVISEINSYQAWYGKNLNIYFGDETFTLDNIRLLEFCRRLKKETHIIYDCQTRLDCIGNKNVLKEMHESGCRWIEIGIETLDSKNIQRFKQDTSILDLEEKLKRIRDSNIAVCFFLINGLPNQSIDSMKSSIDAVCELLSRKLIHASYLFGLVPYPGSLFYENPDSYGIKLHHRDFKYYHEDLLPVYDTTIATAEDIYSVFLDGIKNLGEAMGQESYFGSLGYSSNKNKFGQFWKKYHI